MSNVLIAHHDPEYTREVAAALAGAGYETTVCPSAWEQELVCLRGLLDSCPLADAADVMIYDPSLTDEHLARGSGIPALASAEQNPSVPLMLTSSGRPSNGRVGDIMREVPTAKIAEGGPAAVVAQVRSLIGPAAGPKWSTEVEIGRD